MAAPEKLAALRHLLAERFPAVPSTAGALEVTRFGRALRTDISTIDGTTGGLPLGAVTEVVCATPSCGGHLLLGQLLAVTRTARTRVALIDGADSFDPNSFENDLLAHLLWVRCHSTAEALQCVDLLARDANLGLVVLDIRRALDAELRRIPATQWYRIQRAVERADLAFVVETPRPAVPSAQLRLRFETSHPLSVLQQERPTLVPLLAPAVQRQRVQAAS
jgi:hypothetical protein